MDFWGSLEDAKADCAAAEGAVISSDAGAAHSSLAGSGEAPGSLLAEDTGATEADEGQGRRRAATRRALALASVRCEDCSLVVFEGPAYYDAWHGIASTAGDSSSATGGAPATAEAAAAAAMGAAANGEGGSKSGQACPDAQAAAPSYSSSGGGGVFGRDREDGAGQKRLSFTIRRVARVVPADSVMEHPEARSEMERRRRGFERSVTETGVAAGPKG